MKKSIWFLVILAIIIVAIVTLGGGPKDVDNGTANNTTPTNGDPAVTSPVPVTDTTKVSSKISKFENAELGFEVNYPTSWESENIDTGVRFIMPIDKNQVSTIAKLEAKIEVYASKCKFPAVTTIKDRSTITVGGFPVNMISMSNSVQGRAYFDRMYSLEKGSICYMFSFSSIALSPESKGLTGSNLTQAQNNNKAIVNTADTDFTTLVKTFTFVQGPAGKDETKVAPIK
jgi:hypothetical protein